MPPLPNTEKTPSGALSHFMERVLQAIKRIWNDVEIVRLARNVAWSSVGVVLSQVITLLAYMALARYIGKERFGEFTIIQSTANAVSLFAALGFAITATKYIAELRQRDPEQAGSVMATITLITLVWTSLLTVAIWATAPEIATEVLKRPGLASAVRIGAVLLFFTTVLGLSDLSILTCRCGARRGAGSTRRLCRSRSCHLCDQLQPIEAPLPVAFHSIPPSQWVRKVALYRRFFHTCLSGQHIACAMSLAGTNASHPAAKWIR